mgnify:FL=1
MVSADWHRFQRLGLIQSVEGRIAELCEGVAGWVDAGRIVLQNTLIRVYAYVRTSWNAIERNCPRVVSEETIYVEHCLSDRARELWYAQRGIQR